ncbi:MAG: circularly permuted type 2 ATP-grasp protein [Gallionellaceae bacterium]
MNAQNVFDEMYRGDGEISAAYQGYHDWLEHIPPEQLEQKRNEAGALFRRLGITFAVYGEDAGSERVIPFDIIPRIISAPEWCLISAGSCQRIRALNAFLHDIYHEQQIIRAGRIPAQQVLGNRLYRAEMQGLDVMGEIYAHIAGIDIVRVAENQFYVLEDNLRTPSGVSYMLENRRMMMRLFPELFASQSIAPVDHYPQVLLDNLRAVAPRGMHDPVVVLLSPGAYNSAYFEHAFLAQQMGVELVEGQDLFVENDRVYMRTTQGPKRVDVVYRRIDDEYLDPQTFHHDSVIGVSGLFAAYRAGNVTLANAIGTGVADDKSTYVYVPEMIRFYLGEEPILSNVLTYQLSKKDDLNYVLEHLAELVVKEVQSSGGYGMLVGPASTKQQIADYRSRILDNPDDFIAQPTLALSTCPTFVEKGIAPRHVDLRPYVLSGKEVTLVPGGLTRVAMREGSLVVNSSQGGGTKDTWILED